MTQPPFIRQPITASDELLARRCAHGRVVVIDDDPDILDAIGALMLLEGYACDTHASGHAYLDAIRCNPSDFPGPSCVLSDVTMPEMDGLALQRLLAELGNTPLLLMSGASGAREVASAFRAGAVDFLIKPVDAEVLLSAVARALQISTERQRLSHRQTALAARIASLTQREREVAHAVTQGLTNACIADELGIALRTVKLHRQHALEKLGIHNTAELVRLADECGL